jgi:hypothetical protein
MRIYVSADTCRIVDRVAEQQGLSPEDVVESALRRLKAGAHDQDADPDRKTQHDVERRPRDDSQ